MKRVGLIWKLNIRRFHILAEKNLISRFDIYDFLFMEYKIRFGSSTSKIDFHKKCDVIYLVGFQRIFYYLLSDNITISSWVCCHPLDKSNNLLKQKTTELINRKSTLFHQGDVRHRNNVLNSSKNFTVSMEYTVISIVYFRRGPSD